MKSMWSSHIPNIDLMPVLPILCGSDVEEEEDDEQQSGGAQSGGAGTGATGGDPNSGTDGEDEGDPQKAIKARDEIIARKQSKLEETEQQLQELLEFKQQIEQEKLSDEEKRTQEMENITKERDQLRTGVEKLVLQNAFLSSKEHQWHNPERALALVDLNDLEIVQKNDGSFTVKKPDELKKRIDALAESDPYLLRKDASEEGGGQKKQTWSGATGDPKPSKKAADDAAQREKLAKKYPALRNR